MAKSLLPDPLRRRHLLEQDLDARQSLAIAEAYLQEGRDHEAVQFLAKAKAEEKLQALVDGAIASGDAFLLKQLGDAMSHEFEVAQWLALADAAEACGKARYAEMARRNARSSEV